MSQKIKDLFYNFGIYITDYLLKGKQKREKKMHF